MRFPQKCPRSQSSKAGQPDWLDSGEIVPSWNWNNQRFSSTWKDTISSKHCFPSSQALSLNRGKPQSSCPRHLEVLPTLHQIHVWSLVWMLQTVSWRPLNRARYAKGLLPNICKHIVLDVFWPRICKLIPWCSSGVWSFTNSKPDKIWPCHKHS